VEAPPEFVEPLTHIFYRYGQGGVSVESPAQFNPDEGELPPIPTKVLIRSFIPIDEHSDERKANIEVAIRLVNHLYPIGDLQEREVSDEDWESNWKRFFHPIRIGKGMLICPTWREYCPDGKLVVYLDPGMAFGTGHHPTTRMCMELLEKVVQVGDKVLDLGCGSGILSITAAKLGAKTCVGLEIDSNAVKVAMENSVVNDTTESISIYTGTLPHVDVPSKHFDITVANISSKVIIDLAEPLTKSVKKGGRLVLSGILQDALPSLFESLEVFNVKVNQVVTDGDWAALIATQEQ
jgi:ribosomal protein L11 methyltransferase